MKRFDSSASNDRSLWQPRSRPRALVGWLLGLGALAVAASLSAHGLHLVPGLMFLVAVMATALIGRMAAGLFSVALSGVLLPLFGTASAETRVFDGPGIASIAVFLVLGVILAAGIPSVELAAMTMRNNAERPTFLGGVSLVLEQTLARREALQRLADYVVPEFADWCVIHLLGEDGRIEPVTVAHTDPAKVAVVRELQARRPVDPDADVGVARVLRTGQAELASRIDADLLRRMRADEETVRLVEDLGLRSAILVPLVARGRTMGVISLIVAEGKWSYGPDDLAFASELASRAALTLDTLGAYEQIRATSERNGILQRLATSLSRAVTVDDVVESVLVEGVREMQARGH